ncbi:MAG: 3D domain-containing protein [Candidatus Accumulibacter sp.]|uniref:3D domain-containing protein n=1 Tax=Accumulibacter sp. TaxID=2053492 RepID=UPI002585DBF2|nr:3D domain-containing protein [Accumulibacter sp.]MCM8622200.1 3D domain-containing protein [Accumulibacter sp.]
MGTTGFNVDARYPGGAGDCQGFTESLTYSGDCQTVSGTYRNDDGSSGNDSWTRIGPTIALTRALLTIINATGTPAGGLFGFSTTLLSGSNGVTLAQASGYTTSSNPDYIQLTAPGGGGAPSPGGLARLVAKYTVNSAEAKNDLNTIATFGMSCYMVALESDYGTPPSSCTSTRIAGVTYSGALTNPHGLTGTYCSSFIANVRLQGTGQLNSGSYAHYNTSTSLIDIVTSVTGADGTAVVAGGTVARDRAIIPGRGVLVDVDGVGNGLLANDTGGAIRGYRLDLFNGAGRAACAAYSNPHGVGVCQTPQGTTCPGSTLQ